MNILSSMRYLVALNEHKHFGRAALACHITQPALSNALRALEAEFDVAIVHRSRSFAGLTPEGEQVFASAQRMLHEHQVLQQSLKSTVDRPEGSLTIGAVPTAVPIAARFAAMFQARHPGILPSVLSLSSESELAEEKRLAHDRAVATNTGRAAAGTDATSTLTVVLAWTAVGIPLAWGVYRTLLSASKFFS